MDTSHLAFKPTFSATHSTIIRAPLSEVFHKFGTASAHEDVCRLSSLCTRVDIGEEDRVALNPGESVDGYSFMDREAAKDSSSGESTLAHRQHFVLEETIPVLFGLVNSKVVVSGTLTWVQPSQEELKRGGPVYSVYESQVVGGLAIRIYRLRKMEVVDDGEGEGGEGKKGTKLTEYLYGVGPSYLRWLIAKEAATKHGAHVERYPELFVQ